MRLIPLPIIAALAFTVAPIAMADDDLRTVAERSGFEATARYDEVVDLCERLDDRSDLVRLDTIGKTTEGRSIPMLVVADPPVASAEEAKGSGKLVVLAIGAIHGGEVCGKEALLMLVRELTERPDHPLLNDLILCVVPVFNADGNERIAPDNRPGQVGPAQGMGERQNTQGLDLNRDFMALRSPEVRGLVDTINQWDPHLFIDTHTTDGSAHRYLVSYEGPKNPATHPDVLAYTRDQILPAVADAFVERTGDRAFPYGNFNRDHDRWTTYPANPRFGTTYVGLRNRLSVLSEAYAYATFEDRVRVTLEFVRCCLTEAAARRGAIFELLDRARAETVAAGNQTVPIRSEDAATGLETTVLGFEESSGDSPARSVAGGVPKDYAATLILDFEPTLKVDRPAAYLIPPDVKPVVDLLQGHGVALGRLERDAEIDTEVYRINAVRRVIGGYAGPETFEVEATPRAERRTAPAGSIIAATAQPLGTLAAYLLEPESDDGAATWGLLGDALGTGTDFPILRILATTSLATSPIPPRGIEGKEDEQNRKAITFELLSGPDRPDFDGTPVSARWLGDDRLLLQEGRDESSIVDAETGAAAGADPGRIAEALASLPTIESGDARRLAKEAVAEAEPGRDGLIVEHMNDLYYVALDGSEAARLTSTPGAEELAEWSPDGRYVAFIRDDDLHVVDVETGTERALTTGGTDLARNGKAVWVYFEELFGPELESLLVEPRRRPPRLPPARRRAAREPHRARRHRAPPGRRGDPLSVRRRPEPPRSARHRPGGRGRPALHRPLELPRRLIPHQPRRLVPRRR